MSGEDDHQELLIEWLAECASDPLKFVMGAFPWGEQGTVLAERLGPEEWQRKALESIREGMMTPEVAIREATSSGNGIGKSAFVSWVILWLTTTRADTRGVVTANTERQLKTKTWAELGKWYNLFIAKELFYLDATSFYSRDPDRKLTWRVDMIPWSEHNIVAFQGLHNERKRLFVIKDEASGVPDLIWEAIDGCMTDANTERLWLVFGNPNKPSGRFIECLPGGRFAHRWKSRKIDSRTVSFTDKEEIQKWVDDYGEDSDFVRVRVRGEPPRIGTMQFIGQETVSLAQHRELGEPQPFDPFIIGVDVARFGDDASVIFFRKGRDARSLPPLVLRGVDTMTLAGHVSEAYRRYAADAVFVDGGGVGGGVVDRLRQLQVPVWDIQFGGKADGKGPGASDSGVKYANKRAEIWGGVKEWLGVGCLPTSGDLAAELTGPEYGFNARNEIQLEKKEEMKRRGLASPDIADALALTFSYPVIPSKFAGGEDGRSSYVSEFDPYDAKRLAEVM